MKALEFDGRDGGRFRLVELPLPPLRRGDVRVRVLSAGFNPIDSQLRRQLAAGAGPPTILGRDLSGVVDAVGEGVADFVPGDEVYGYVCRLASSGTYAESVSVPTELLARKPASLSHDGAAAIPVAAVTATLAMRKVRADPSRSLFIAGGAGGVGSLAVGLARRLGIARLVVTAGSAASRDYLSRTFGLSEAQLVNYREPGFVALARERNGGDFDAVIDLVGGAMLSASCSLVGLEGDLASVTEAPRAEDFDRLFDRNASFHAVGANAYSLVDDRAEWRRYGLLLEDIGGMLDRRELQPPQVSNVGPLAVETALRAHDLLERSAVQGKLVMSCAAPT